MSEIFVSHIVMPITMARAERHHARVEIVHNGRWRVRKQDKWIDA